MRKRRNGQEAEDWELNEGETDHDVEMKDQRRYDTHEQMIIRCRNLDAKEGRRFEGIQIER